MKKATLLIFNHSDEEFSTRVIGENNDFLEGPWHGLESLMRAYFWTITNGYKVTEIRQENV